MNLQRCLSLIFFALFLALSLQADDNSPEAVRKALEKMPRPWKKPADKRPPEQEDYSRWQDILPGRQLKEDHFAPLMKYYAAKSANFSWKEFTKNASGQLLYLVILTDRGVDDSNKSVVLITSLDGGPEKTGPTSAFRLIEYLVSDDSEAKETLKNHIFLIVPVMNPAGFFNYKPHPANINIYTGNRGAIWQMPEMQLKEPEKVPELAALVEFIDEYKPELHVDLHGIDPNYEGRIMVETTGCAGSNSTLRSWDIRVVDAMNSAGNKAGYAYFRPEIEMQRLIGGSAAFNSVTGYMENGSPLVYSGMYGYFHYHTLPLVMEIAWEESALARLKGLFAIGNKQNPHFPNGYPVEVMKAADTGASIISYGITASARRQSRSELWRKQQDLTIGVLYPMYEGREFFYCAVGANGVQNIFGEGKPGVILKKDRILPFLLNAPGVNKPALEQFLKVGPENMFWTYIPQLLRQVEPLSNGISLRCLIQHKDPEILDVRLNGNLLKEDPSNGFSFAQIDGKTLLTVNIPPEYSSRHNLFIVTCAYKGKQARKHWVPPEDLMTGKN